MRLIDMHCDTLDECYEKQYGLRQNEGQVDLRSMQENGAMGQFFAIFLPKFDRQGCLTDQRELFDAIYLVYQRELRRNEDILAPVHSYHDIDSNCNAGKISSILTIENGDLLQGDLAQLDTLYEKGIRLITLLWNDENCIGFPNSPDPCAHQRGLKPFGFQVVEEMERLGMIVDVSHLSEGGFYDVARSAKKPFVASHSCVRALCDHPRNLTDGQIRALTQAGGVIGVNYNAPFLRRDAGTSTIEDIMRHIEYIYQKGGEDCVALGSDFDGIACDLEFNGYQGYHRLVSALSKRYSQRIVEKFCSKNVLGVMRECMC